MKRALDQFIERWMRKDGRRVPTRLQAALALLEKLRDSPSLNLDGHLASKGSSGLQSHETFGDRAHERLGIEPINKNHGRWSSGLDDWGQDLLDILRAHGFALAEPSIREAMIDQAQAVLGGILRAILAQGPFEVPIAGLSAEAVIRDVMNQAQEKNRSADVAQCLVGAHLSLYLKRAIPVRAPNKGEPKSRSDLYTRPLNYEVEDAVIEVAIGLPDDKRLTQIANTLEASEAEVWLLTRSDRVPAWKNELEACDDIDSRRVVVTSVEAFIGQNITELGEFSAPRRIEQLKALFKLYNEKWVQEVGTPGIRITTK